MTDQLTSPVVIEALEIAPVEWTVAAWPGYAQPRDTQMSIGAVPGLPGLRFRYQRGHQWRDLRPATEADLDHALRYWLFEWLPERTGDYVEVFIAADGPGRSINCRPGEFWATVHNDVSPIEAAASAVVATLEIKDA